MQREHDIPFSRELVRKSIHLSSLSIPIAYYYWSRQTMLEILIPLAAVSVLLDMGRFYIPTLAKWFYAAFRPLLREHERDHSRKLLSGASYVFVSAVICIFIFPKLITVTSFSVLIISDTTAALVGRKYGKNKFFHKSLEGAAGFFISALVVITVVPKLQDGGAEYIVAIIGAAVATVVESASIEMRMDDNLSIPLSMGLTMYILFYALSVMQPDQYLSLYNALVAYQ
ncbi:MAG TPA: SEC59/DGK1/VTE5 family protein [Candidatus Kapabacteria bacterium]|nr:SEC59/DGK1/VTE5 family protein [Candidatus Kapabacteria bacterium]